ncbi:MAG: ribonuclease Z [Clostridiales bacterium]|nr:ribonuclease Z [Clostridiales bacterium]
MILIICVDDGMGMAFNRRRQSRDRILTERILDITGDGVLWTDPYSEKLFAESKGNSRRVTDNCLEKAGPGEFCFVETRDPFPFADRVEKLILFRWNRAYPSSLKFRFPLEQWKKQGTWEFAGYSHEKITQEVYIR